MLNHLYIGYIPIWGDMEVWWDASSRHTRAYGEQSIWEMSTYPQYLYIAQCSVYHGMRTSMLLLYVQYTSLQWWYISLVYAYSIRVHHRVHSATSTVVTIYTCSGVSGGMHPTILSLTQSILSVGVSIPSTYIPYTEISIHTRISGIQGSRYHVMMWYSWGDT